MPLDAVLDRQLSIISGKGGVGKTTIAAMLGIIASSQGRRTLIAEVEGKAGLAGLFGLDAMTTEPRELAPDLFGMNITPEEALSEYLDVQFHMKRIAKPLVSSQLTDYATHAAPGLRDILMLGKVWYAVTRRGSFDTVILDSPAAGHTVSMLKSPEGLLHAIPVGPLANHARQIVAWLKDPSRVSVHLVSMAEETPVNETIETTRLLEEKVGTDVANVFLNMLYPRIPELVPGVTVVDRATAAGLKKEAAAELQACANFYSARIELQRQHSATLTQAMRETATIVELPYLFTGDIRIDELNRLAAIALEQL